MPLGLSDRIAPSPCLQAVGALRNTGSIAAFKLTWVPPIPSHHHRNKVTRQCSDLHLPPTTYWLTRNHVLLPQGEPRKKLSPRNLPLRVAGTCGSMQHLSDDVLQELQQQGTRQAQQQGRRSGSSSSGGRGGRSSSASEASLSLTATHSSHATSSPSPTASLLGETFKSPRKPSQAQEKSRRGSRAGLSTWQPSTGSQQARSRPGSGSRASRAPPRPSAAGPLPPQLLGGRAGPNADVLTAKATPESGALTADHHTSTAIQSHSLLSPSWSTQYISCSPQRETTLTTPIDMKLIFHSHGAQARMNRHPKGRALAARRRLQDRKLHISLKPAALPTCYATTEETGDS